MIQIPIDTGTLPSVDLQVNNPRLNGVFINTKKEIQLLPHTTLTTFFSDLRAIFQSSFNNRTILVTNDDVYYVENEVLVEVATITNSSFAIRLSENIQGQVCIVNGIGAWAFNQSANTFFKLGDSQGFDLNFPTDVTSLNTFLVVTGGREKKWIVSNANDITQWGANEVQEGDSHLGDLVGVRVLENNLFIFGTGGVQRWVPSIERVPNSFPFSQDPTYKDEYGCASTSSLSAENNELFYLSDNGQIRRMMATGRSTITNDGIENIINSYTNVDKSFGSYYFWKGHWLYQLTFSDNETAFVYSSKSGKWSESSDLIIGFDDVPIKSDGVYDFDTDYSQSFNKILIQTPYIKPRLKDLSKRTVLGAVMLEMTQGKTTNETNQRCFLSLSKDNIQYGNSVKRSFSKTANRLFQFRWYMNYVNNGFSLRFELQTKTDITITSAWYELS